jgi:hypothetical protein
MPRQGDTLMAFFPDPGRHAAWRDAARSFAERLDAERRGKKVGFDWAMLNLIAIDEENLPVICVHCDLKKRIACYRRGELAEWPDPDHDIYAMRHKNGDVFWIDIGSGQWRSADNAQRGRDLISLAAMLWGCKYGRAAWRISQLCNLREIPRHD